MLLLGAFVGPLPAAPGPALPSEPAPTPAEGAPEDRAIRSERNMQLAVEHADEERFQDAAIHAIRAYELLDEEAKLGETGLFVLSSATEHSLRAYEQLRDPDRLAAIQPLLEVFLERHQGVGPKVEELQRKLELVRGERLAISRAHLDGKRYQRAAEEAERCYLTMMEADRRREIGAQAAIAASVAYRNQWHVDNDIHHLEAAVALIDDHLGRAGESASGKARQERRRLTRDLALAQARGGAIEDVDDAGGAGSMTRRDRSFLIASGAALGGGVAASVGAALLGRQSIRHEAISIDEFGRVRSPGHIVGATALGATGAVVTGLAVHSLVDAGFLRSRDRRIVAITGLAVGLAGSIAGTTMLATGQHGESSSARASLSNAGIGVLVSMGTPLGAGIAALVSRRGGS